MDEFDATAALARIEERFVGITFTATNAANILPAMLRPIIFVQDGFVFRAQTLVYGRVIGGRHVAELVVCVGRERRRRREGSVSALCKSELESRRQIVLPLHQEGRVEGWEEEQVQWAAGCESRGVWTVGWQFECRAVWSVELW